MHLQRFFKRVTFFNIISSFCCIEIESYGLKTSVQIIIIACIVNLLKTKKLFLGLEMGKLVLRVRLFLNIGIALRWKTSV